MLVPLNEMSCTLNHILLLVLAAYSGKDINISRCSPSRMSLRWPSPCYRALRDVAALLPNSSPSCFCASRKSRTACRSLSTVAFASLARHVLALCILCWYASSCLSWPFSLISRSISCGRLSFDGCFVACNRAGVASSATVEPRLQSITISTEVGVGGPSFDIFVVVVTTRIGVSVSLRSSVFRVMKLCKASTVGLRAGNQF